MPDDAFTQHQAADLASAWLQHKKLETFVKAELCEEGRNRHTFLVNGKWIMRVPKSDDLQKLRVVTEALPYLTRALDPIKVPFPDPEAWGWKTPFMWYQVIAGEKWKPVEPSDAQAQSFLDLLRKIQKCDPKQLPGVPRLSTNEASTWYPCVKKLFKRVSNRMAPSLSEKCDAFLLSGRGAAPYGGSALPVHKDLAMGNLLWNDDRTAIVGVFDWDDFGIGDPAHDYAALLRWIGAPMFRSLLQNQSLSKDESFDSLFDRAVFLGIRAGLETLEGGRPGGEGLVERCLAS